MKRPRVVSREYKVMLRAKRFAGSERAMLKAADALWNDFSDGVDAVALGTKGTLDTIEGPRLITFYDTSKDHLNQHHYVFRERRRVGDGAREVTVKFRHPDRYVTEGRTMKARATGVTAKTKFEEDVKGPFKSLYSFSTTLPVAGGKAFSSLADV